jgi:hypothetical protein
MLVLELFVVMAALTMLTGLFALTHGILLLLSGLLTPALLLTRTLARRLVLLTRILALLLCHWGTLPC